MRLIDADALLAEIIKNNSHQVGECVITFDCGAEAAINNAPTIDAVPVVRCRECVHCLWDELHKNKKGRCMEHHLWCEADGFCHKGEKMDGGVSNDER